MLNPSRLLTLTGILLFSLCYVSVARSDHADPPGRVARVNDTQGVVSYSPAGEDEWINVVRNRPLIRGDRLWTDHNARVEFQVGSTAIRLGSNTSAEILNLNDDVAQIQMTQGTINLSVRRLYPGQSYEVATPTLAFVINRAGRYRIDVDPYDDQTTIVVWEGAGEAYGDRTHFPLHAGDTVRFYSADLRDYQMYGLPRADNFDRYSLRRDQLLERSLSLRYVDDDMVGYSDLDEYGSWRPVQRYGTVWFPNRVDAHWAPYRDGHWVWQEPWGWTWVDNAPWGFAPSHYGRWVYVSHRWGWIPGPRNVRPIYAPALVAFIGGSGWSVSLSLGGGSPIGWFPLGPREVYVPSYRASRNYFTQVNVNNTVINNTTINNVYNNYASGDINVTQVNYANRSVTGAVTAVPSTVFMNAKPVRTAAIQIDSKAITTGEITRVAPIAPSKQSVIGADTADVKTRPSREAFNRRVVARNAPPPGERSFAEREQQLQKNPGRALETDTARSTPNRDVETTSNREADNTPNRDVNTTKNRDGNTTPSRDVVDTTKNREANSTPNRDVDTTKNREADTTPNRDINIAKNRDDDITLNRNGKTAKNVHVIGEQHDAVDVREAGPRRGDVKTAAPTDKPDQLQPLDRSAETRNGPERGMGARSQREDHTNQDDAQQIAMQQQAERQAECERQAIQRHQDVRQCQSETQQQSDKRPLIDPQL